MRLEFSEEAEREIRNAAEWYEARAPGLGKTFLLALDSALDAIRRNPNAYTLVAKNARRFMVHRFPYGIIYQSRDDVIRIAACFHSHRDPKQWRKRL